MMKIQAEGRKEEVVDTMCDNGALKNPLKQCSSGACSTKERAAGDKLSICVMELREDLDEVDGKQ